MVVIRTRELAEILNMSPKTIENWSSTQPHRLPPKFKKYGDLPRWLLCDVWFWMGAQTAPGAAGPSAEPSPAAPAVSKPKRGCPQKAERDAARAAGKTVKQFRQLKKEQAAGGMQNAISF